MDDARIMERNDEVFWAATDELAKAKVNTLGETLGVKPGSQQQAVLVQKLDYEDQLIPNMGLFNMCTHCGLTFPGKLWHECKIGTKFTIDDFNRHASELSADKFFMERRAHSGQQEVRMEMPLRMGLSCRIQAAI